MDEPLSNLDAKLRIEMRAEISKLCRSLKITTFYVTHDQLEALTMGHRIVVMRNGVAQQIDTPQSIYDRPINGFVAGFIGSPPMNFLRATSGADGVLFGRGFELRTTGAVREALETRKGDVLAGIRPEHLSPHHEHDGPTGWLSGRIELIETLGSELMVQLIVGDNLVTAQFERGGAPLAIGDEITLAHRPDAVHAFDLGTERSVIAPSGAAESAGTIQGGQATIAASGANTVAVTGKEKIVIPDTGKPFKIGFAIWSLHNPYFVLMRDVSDAIAKAYGGTVVFLDAHGDAATQLGQVEDLVNSHVDGIIISPTDSVSLVPAVEAANQAGIPVVTVDNSIYGGKIAGTFIANNYAAGRGAAEVMAQKLGGEGNIVVLDLPMAESARSRVTALYDMLKANPKISVLAQQNCADKDCGRDIMENWLTRFGDKIDAVFTINEPGAIGAMSAVDTAGLKGKIFAVTVDGMREGIAKQKEGMDIEAIGEQFPQTQAEMATKLLISIIRGKSVPAAWQGKTCLIESDVILKTDTTAGKYDYKWQPYAYAKDQ
jgi:ABC-type sugar transport system substrate-binding protein